MKRVKVRYRSPMFEITAGDEIVDSVVRPLNTHLHEPPQIVDRSGTTMRLRDAISLVLGILSCAIGLKPRLMRQNALVRPVISSSSSKLFFKVAESDEAVALDGDVEFQTFDDSSSNILQKLSRGFVPLAASIGFAATPSPVIATRLAGAGIHYFIISEDITNTLHE
jgi:hypothetical protein